MPCGAAAGKSRPAALCAPLATVCGCESRKGRRGRDVGTVAECGCTHRFDRRALVRRYPSCSHCRRAGGPDRNGACDRGSCVPRRGDLADRHHHHDHRSARRGCRVRACQPGRRGGDSDSLAGGGRPPLPAREPRARRGLARESRAISDPRRTADDSGDRLRDTHPLVGMDSPAVTSDPGDLRLQPVSAATDAGRRDVESAPDVADG